MKTLLKQSFEIFDVYGKQPEAIDTISNVFFDVLEDQEMVDITAAFKEYSRTETVFPKPADIRKLAISAFRDRKDRERHGKQKSAPGGWAGKKFPQLDAQTRSDLLDYLRQLSEDALKKELYYHVAFKGMPESVANELLQGGEIEL